MSFFSWIRESGVLSILDFSRVLKPRSFFSSHWDFSYYTTYEKNQPQTIRKLYADNKIGSPDNEDCPFRLKLEKDNLYRPYISFAFKDLVVFDMKGTNMLGDVLSRAFCMVLQFLNDRKSRIWGKGHQNDPIKLLGLFYAGRLFVWRVNLLLNVLKVK